MSGWFKTFAFIEDGGKRRFNFINVGGVFGVSFALLFAGFQFAFDQPPAGISKKVDKKIITNGVTVKSDLPTQTSSNLPIQDANSINPNEKIVPRNSNSPIKISYRAKQVLVRTDIKDLKKGLPTGSNIIGKLLSAIDSRDLSGPIKVLLPYGASFKGEQFIEKNSLLIGRASYSGKGERIFLSFDKAITPSGEEKSIMATALDSADYANGLIGEVHSETTMRVAGTLGLTMISSMTDVLTEKTAHGEFGSTTPNSTMKNAVLQGVSKVSEMEAGRQAEAMAQTPPYVTLEAGADLIISLNSSFGLENE